MKIHDKLYQWVRIGAGREPSPSEVAVDSQSVETATMKYKEVGYDSGKKIQVRKRHLAVDLLGLVLRVLVTSASIPECAGASKVLKRVHRTGAPFGRLAPLIALNVYIGFGWMGDIAVKTLCVG